MARRPFIVAALILCAAWALAAAPAASADSHEPILIDPAGDAYENTPEDTAWIIHGACSGALGLRDTCEPLRPPQDMPHAGTPAPPGLDIVGVHMRDTPEHLIVELDVARLDAGLSDALPRDGYVVWNVCWGSPECVTALARRADGHLDVLAYTAHLDASCSMILVCVAPVDIELQPGAPGTVRWTVPRALLNASALGDALSDVYAGTTAYGATESVEWAVATPLRSPSGYYYGGGGSPDTASGGRAFRFGTPSASSYDAIAQLERVDLEGEAPSLEADIRRIAFAENETTFTMAFEMGRVNVTTPRASLQGALSLSNGPSLAIHVMAEGDERDVTALLCGDVGCTYRVEAPARLDVAEGEPGWINVTFNRHDLNHPPRGTRVTIAWAGTGGVETTRIDQVPAAQAEVVRWPPGDWLAMGPPYALRHDSFLTEEDREGHESHGVVIRDPASDAASENAAVDTSSGMFDLVLASVEGTSPTSSRVTIGVRDLSRISLPAGAKAVTYSVAVETEHGATMVGFYRDSGRGEFFCSSDTLVLAEEKQDPAEAAWTTLEGVLSVAREAGGGAIGGGGTSPSTLTIFVPHSCFGTDEPGEIHARSLAAAIHVIPQNAMPGVPLQRIETVDEARDDTVTAFALGAAVPADAAPAWYAQPFGIENFWDITGILLAVVLAVAGFVAVRRKRNALHRYMEQIDRALGAHVADAKGRELALVGIRRRLKDDLVRGRITEAHYLLVEARLAEHLKSARLHEMSEAFGELPYRLLQKLLEVLADGTITSDEARRFGAMLEDSGFTPEAKEHIKRKLAMWVVDDAPA